MPLRIVLVVGRGHFQGEDPAEHAPGGDGDAFEGVVRLEGIKRSTTQKNWPPFGPKQQTTQQTQSESTDLSLEVACHEIGEIEAEVDPGIPHGDIERNTGQQGCFLGLCKGAREKQASPRVVLVTEDELNTDRLPCTRQGQQCFSLVGTHHRGIVSPCRRVL